MATADNWRSTHNGPSASRKPARARRADRATCHSPRAAKLAATTSLLLTLASSAVGQNNAGEPTIKDTRDWVQLDRVVATINDAVILQSEVLNDANLRLGEAHRQVTQTATPLFEIALATGFTTQASFARAFKAAFNTTASNLRRA